MAQNTNEAQSQAQSEWKKREIGVFWKRSGQTGEYYSGFVTIDGVKKEVVMYPNRNKTQENHPDLNLYSSKPRTAPSPAPKAAVSPAPTSTGPRKTPPRPVSGAVKVPAVQAVAASDDGFEVPED